MRVFQSRPRAAFRLWVIAGLAIGALAASAGATTYRLMPMSETIKKSEQIFTAVVDSKHSDFRNGSVVTTYRMRPTGFIKGSLTLDASGTVGMEEMGGSFHGAFRLGQRIVGSVPMIPGEEVLLFTRIYNPAPEARTAAEPSPITPGTPILVSQRDGRFSILTDADSGEKYVVRPDAGAMGDVPNDKAVKAFLSGKIKGLKEGVARQRASRPTRLKAADSAAIHDFDSLDEVRERIKRETATEKK